MSQTPLQAPPAPFKVFVFQGFTFPSEAELDHMHAAGVDGVIVGINNEDDDRDGVRAADLDDTFVWRFGATSGPAALHGCIEACAKRFMTCWPMIWARPTDRYNEAAALALEPFLGLDGFGGVVHDAERYWHKLLTLGRMTPEQGAELWARHFGRDGVVHLLTDYASLPPSVEPLARACAGMIPQAYSRHSWVIKDSVWAAGQTQRRAGRTWGKLRAAGVQSLDDGTPVLVQGGVPVTHGRPLYMGLGAYDLGPRPEAWLAAQIQGAKDAGCDGVAFWSYKAAQKEGHVPLMLKLCAALRQP